MLANRRVRLADLVEALGRACTRALADSAPAGQIHGPGRHLLLIQDTTEVNVQSHAGRIQPGSGLGVISDGESMGWLLHPTLVLDAGTETALGIADLQ